MHILYFTIHAWYVLCGFNPNKEKRDADPDLREEQYFIFFHFFWGREPEIARISGLWGARVSLVRGASCEPRGKP